MFGSNSIIILLRMSSDSMSKIVVNSELMKAYYII